MDMITCYDDKLKLACKLAENCVNWPVGCLIEYAGQHYDPDKLFDLNCDQLRNFVYDLYTEELLTLSEQELLDLQKGVEGRERKLKTCE